MIIKSFLFLHFTSLSAIFFRTLFNAAFNVFSNLFDKKGNRQSTNSYNYFSYVFFFLKKKCYSAIRYICTTMAVQLLSKIIFRNQRKSMVHILEINSFSSANNKLMHGIGVKFNKESDHCYLLKLNTTSI